MLIDKTSTNSAKLREISRIFQKYSTVLKVMTIFNSLENSGNYFEICKAS